MRIYPFKLHFPDGVPYARFPFVMDDQPIAGISCALSGRGAGSMTRAVGAETPVRSALWAALGVDARFLHAPAQFHSRELALAEGPATTAAAADGLVSADPACYLSVTVADCLPVFLLDTEHGIFALLHSGWQGTGIVSRALDLMSARGRTRPAAVAAVLGPCISAAAYAVDPERARAFEAEFGGPGGDYPLGPVVKAGRYIDLQAANARLLAAAGVRHTAVCQDCTYSDPRLGSFRREGPDAYTRMAAVVGNF